MSSIYSPIVNIDKRSLVGNSPQLPQDNYYMLLAIEEAKKGQYTTRPNPAVGCVITKNSMIVGIGFHPKAGEPHAEVFALRAAQSESVNSTAYVTLEPCSHFGRTPPCALALIEAGVKRVVIAGLDPNPKVAGRGISMLIEAGIEVTVGVACAEAETLNLGFLKVMRSGMPYVRLKTATSLDGRTAMASGESKWITGQAAREDVQHLRALSGAIVTGSQTVIDDDPSLNVRSNRLGTDTLLIPQPRVIVLDRRNRLANTSYNVLKKAETLVWKKDNLTELLSYLVETYQIHDVLVEAGSNVSGSFITAGLVDEWIVYQAPCVLGNHSKPMLQLDVQNLANQHRFKFENVECVGNDIKLSLKPIS